MSAVRVPRFDFRHDGLFRFRFSRQSHRFTPNPVLFPLMESVPPSPDD